MPKGMCTGCWNYGELATDSEGFALNLCPSCKEREDGRNMRDDGNAKGMVRTLPRSETR